MYVYLHDRCSMFCAAHMVSEMASYQIPAVEPFNFQQPDWERWIRRFERFRLASGLADKSEESQVNTLVYAMGDKAEDILRSFKLTAEQEKVYNTVKEKYQGYFVKRRNVVYERAKFNKGHKAKGSQ